MKQKKLVEKLPVTKIYSILGNELADVIHYAIAIACGMDMNKIILEKIKVASVKYHHKISSGAVSPGQESRQWLYQNHLVVLESVAPYRINKACSMI